MLVFGGLLRSVFCGLLPSFLTGSTNTKGQFSFTGLPASEYLLEVIVDEEVVASASATLADGAMQVSGVVAASAAVDSDPGGVVGEPSQGDLRRSGHGGVRRVHRPVVLPGV